MTEFQVLTHRNTPPVFQTGKKPAAGEVGHFVAINYIAADKPSSLMRFTQMFNNNTAGEIPGFISMQVLEPQNDRYVTPQSARSYGENGLSIDRTSVYLVISHWKNEKSFQNWTRSAQFIHNSKFYASRKCQ